MGKKKVGIPDKAQLKQELKRERRKIRRREMISGTIEALLVAGAVTVLAATLFVPVMRIDGSSMEPSLHEGELVVSLRNGKWKKGDIVAFYNNNKVMIKRIIATEGETVDIDGDGIVYVNEIPLKETYLKNGRPALGKCNIALPCKVPEGSVFVMGDNRETSVDSRSIDIGCVSDEQIVSRVTFRIWPISGFGPVD